MAGQLYVMSKTATSFVFIPKMEFFNYTDAVNKSESGKPMVRGLVYYKDFTDKPVTLSLIDKTTFDSVSFNITSTIVNTHFETLIPGTYDIELAGKIVNTLTIKLGGIYTILASVSDDKIKAHTITVTDPNSMHILWLIPQYIIITMAEVMFSVTGLEFAFTQAPTSMKSLLQAGWLLTVAFGNLVVVIIAEVKFFDTQVS